MSISINNLSVDLNEVAYCTSLLDFSVDVVDDIYNITTSGTYFTYNGTTVSGYLTTISGGYRLSYTTLPSGNVSLIAYASNDNQEHYYREYSFQYGYQVSWNNVNYWGNNKEVAISVSATNTSLASNTTYFSTFFRTRGVANTDLGAIISADGSGNKDIMGYIEPQSKYFMYGKTYSITISGIRDFSGNSLPAATYSFTIEEIN